MRTPAGFECKYFYGNYFRGRNEEECRLIGNTPPPHNWTPDLMQNLSCAGNSVGQCLPKPGFAWRSGLPVVQAKTARQSQRLLHQRARRMLLSQKLAADYAIRKSTSSSRTKNNMNFTLLLDLDNTLIGNDMGSFLPVYFKSLERQVPPMARGRIYQEIVGCNPGDGCKKSAKIDP